MIPFFITEHTIKKDSINLGKEMVNIFTLRKYLILKSGRLFSTSICAGSAVLLYFILNLFIFE